MRYRGFEDAKKKTGEEWHFDFSDIWRSEIETNEINPEDVEENSNQEDSQNAEEVEEGESSERDNDE